MGKRYYCDYCDRSFKDDTEARKKHLSSLQHARNRSEHYDQFKDPATILNEETAKTPCKRFMAHGDCAFGIGCRFSHYTPQMLWELEEYVYFRDRQKSENRRVDFPRSSDIVKEFFEGLNPGEYSAEDEIQADWSFPIELQNYPNLPPSLWPINPRGLNECKSFGRWGK